jgi:GxxExxY protein
MRRTDIPARLNDLTRVVLECAFEIHDEFGPGMMERIYRHLLAHKLRQRGFRVETEVWLDLRYDGMVLRRCFRMDIVIEAQVVVEIKAVEQLHPVHHAQLLSYLRLSGYPVGLLINFNTQLLRDGIHRVVSTAPPPHRATA